MGETCNTHGRDNIDLYKILVWKMNGRNHLGIDGSTILGRKKEDTEALEREF
jgi:hypothetical protein